MYEDIINDLNTKLRFTHGDNITNYDSGYIYDIFVSIADSNIHIYTSDLFDWGKNNFEYIDKATREFGNPNDIIKQIQQGEYYAFEQELYDNRYDILKLFAYTYLRDNEISINDEQIDELDSYIENLDSNDKLEYITDYCNSLNNSFEVA